MSNTKAKTKIETAFAKREEYEIENKASDNKFRELNKAKNAFMHESVQAFIDAENFDMSFLNTQTNKASRFSVKAALKVANIMHAIAAKKADLLDNHTRTIIEQFAHLADKKRAYDYNELKSMQSASVTTSLSTSLNQDKRKAYDVATLSTQTSSTMQALRVLDLTERDTNEKRKHERVKFSDKRLAFMFK